jgi:hypothetical protein
MKKIGFVILALVLIMGTMGVGYSMWSQTINVSGQVDTGNVCWEFYNCLLADQFSPAMTGGYVAPPSWPSPPFPSWGSIYGDYSTQNGFVGGFFHLDKNVSWGECAISADGKTLTTTLYNTYPCNFNELSWYVKNCGTLPIRIDHIDILDNLGHVIATFNNEGSVTVVGLDLNQDGNADIEVRYGDNFGLQIEPNTESPAEFSLWIHTLQAAPQGATLTFSIKIYAVQWNEYPMPVGP